MTHEQKPESAEFRTREAQRAALAEALEDGMSRSVSAEEAERHIAEAEDRGAAEQRRKGEPEFEKIVAERDDAEDFIRKMAEIVLGEAVEWSNVYGFQNALDEVSERIYLLEKKAANVAALEARVKELEGEVERLKKPQWFGVDEDSYGSPYEALECLEIEPLQILEMMGFAATGLVWAFHDGKRSHRFATEADARNAAAAIREGEQL